MPQHYLLGIDGGGTHCRARLTDDKSHILAECHSGAANAFTDFSGTTGVIEQLIKDVFIAAGLAAEVRSQTTIVAGLAGANVPSVAQALNAWRSADGNFYCCTDVEIACMGAHLGKAGAVLILGTGSQGAAWDGQRFSLLGGWGFALSDQGSGAELGHRALRHALLAHESILPATPLTRELMARFKNSPETLLLWTRQASPGDWASCAPAVFAAADAGDAAASQLLGESAQEITLLINQLERLSHGPIALMGGIAAPILPWLPANIRLKLTPPQGDALSGALLLAQRHTKNTPAV